jgi:hypothetical protein
MPLGIPDDELLNLLMDSQLGERTKTDIVNLDSGETLIFAGSRVRKVALRKIAEGYPSIRITPGPVRDGVMRAFARYAELLSVLGLRPEVVALKNPVLPKSGKVKLTCQVSPETRTALVIIRGRGLMRWWKRERDVTVSDALQRSRFQEVSRGYQKEVRAVFALTVTSDEEGFSHPSRNRPHQIPP